jgi:hypothetical protein
VDSIVQPVLRFFGLDWQPNHGVTPFLCALAFTYITSTIIALKQVYTGQCGMLAPPPLFVTESANVLCFVVVTLRSVRGSVPPRRPSLQAGAGPPALPGLPAESHVLLRC